MNTFAPTPVSIYPPGRPSSDASGPGLVGTHHLTSLALLVPAPYGALTDQAVLSAHMPLCWGCFQELFFFFFLKPGVILPKPWVIRLYAFWNLWGPWMTQFSMTAIQLWNSEWKIYHVHKQLFLIHENEVSVSGTVDSPQLVWNDIMSFYKLPRMSKLFGKEGWKYSLLMNSSSESLLPWQRGRGKPLLHR